MSTLHLFKIEEVDGEIDSTDAQNTPAELCADLGPFDMDVASNPRSMIQAKRHVMLERGEDGLTVEWRGSVWCNGPYSDPLPWCIRLARYMGPWAALWKLDPTTEWFRVLATHCQWAPFRKRIRFEREGNNGNVANFPSVLMWGGGWTPSVRVINRLWVR